MCNLYPYSIFILILQRSTKIYKVYIDKISVTTIEKNPLNFEPTAVGNPAKTLLLLTHPKMGTKHPKFDLFSTCRESHGFGFSQSLGNSQIRTKTVTMLRKPYPDLI